VLLDFLAYTLDGFARLWTATRRALGPMNWGRRGQRQDEDPERRDR